MSTSNRIIKLNKKRPVVLSIAGSDSGGGAGIQADIKTLSSLNTFAITAITALTAQNTRGVQSVEAVNEDFFSEQLESLKSDFQIDAVKIGMLHRREIISRVCDFLKKNSFPFVVLDPVMVSSSGDPLMESEALAMIKNDLLPLANLVTPNHHEAGILAGSIPESYEDFEPSAKNIIVQGAKSVLLKGGDFPDKWSRDYFYSKEGGLWLDSEKLDSKHTHGTGCSLSSAIAALVAHGQSLKEAVAMAKHYVYQAIAHASEERIGSGDNLPLNHNFNNKLEF